MNKNEPLLHFGDDSEESKNTRNSGQTNIGGHIRFNGFDDEPADVQPVKEPVAKPVQKPLVQPAQEPSQPAAQPVKPSQPVSPVVQPAKSPAAAKPQQPQPQQQKPPKRPVAQKVNPDDMFGKKNLRINLIVVNGSGVVLPQFKVDQTVVKSGQEITFNESREVYELTVGADGYKDRRIHVTQTDLLKGEKRVSLATQLQSLMVSFNTPDGIKRGSVDIDQASPIYEFIRDAYHSDTPLNELQIGGVGGNHKPRTGKVSIFPYFLALIIGVLLGIGVMAMFTCGDTNAEDQTKVLTEDPKDAEVLVEDETANEQTLNPQDEQAAPATEDVTPDSNPEEEANAEEESEEKVEDVTTKMGDTDVKYMKEKDTWERGAASSDDAKRLFAAFCSGDIDAIISANPYNNGDEKSRNGYYNKVLNDLKRLKQQSNYEDVKVAVRDACRDGKINLRRILDRIHPMLKKQ